ncbi:MAG: hypothetical protein A2958_02050 [Candidatus Levybacteria bacterium RIFCSPLOWO2_01_FULL_38_13]|nr:MAG: hypothetical protein A2629_02805 [Candidatus Levybacteria bacterium RIFCSPHIGHO2_01_FULL_41_15]OGH35734.1 MAG: hypothetical protein A2958_02050 [Candidatus Levybacteria bacterium RIFCSPLOWO2_01_FULL_38_13]
MRLSEILSRRLSETSRSPLCTRKPEEVTFPWAKKWFRKGRENGISNYDLHNASVKGFVVIGDIIRLSRESHPDDNGKSTSELVFVGPATPFIDPKTGSVSHLFFDPTLPNGLSLTVVRDITSWKTIGKLHQKDQLSRLARVVREYEAQQK